MNIIRWCNENAVAFGCVVNEDSPQQVRALAEHVYKNILNSIIANEKAN